MGAERGGGAAVIVVGGALRRERAAASLAALPAEVGLERDRDRVHFLDDDVARRDVARRDRVPTARRVAAVDDGGRPRRRLRRRVGVDPSPLTRRAGGPVHVRVGAVGGDRHRVGRIGVV